MRLVEFSQAFMGHLRGGLAHVNVLSSMLFAGLSGSAVADTSALGSMLIPAMEKQGYSRKFAAAITAASSVIGPIIPPSGIMIIYAYVMGESVAALFLAKNNAATLSPITYAYIIIIPEGGMIGPITELAAVIAAANFLEYPCFSMAGINIEPRAEVSATAEPDNPANNMDDKTFTCANPPLRCPINA